MFLLSSITSYKEYDQTSTTTQHSISQLRSESVKFDTKWVDKLVENRVTASCKKSLLIQHPWCSTILYCLAKIKSLKYKCHSLNYSKSKTSFNCDYSNVPTLKPLLIQYSLCRFISYSIVHSAAPIKVPPGADRPPAPLSYATVHYQMPCTQL